jgi:peptidyl-prolyl cis-trans isomerase A (cyclophilin A)
MRTISWTASRRLLAAALVAALAACSAPAPTPSPSPSPTTAATLAPRPSASPAASPGPAASAAPSAAPAGGRAALLDPSKATAKAPASYRARFTTTRGVFVVAVTRAWAPLGADRFYNLVQAGFFDGARFFRVVPRFVVQFGLGGDPRANAAWESARIADDPVKQTNARGRITFATAGPGTRTTQLFINLADNPRLDQMGFSPFGEVSGEGMQVVSAIYPGYGELPDQGRITAEGNVYLEAQFPRLDYVKKAEIVR